MVIGCYKISCSFGHFKTYYSKTDFFPIDLSLKPMKNTMFFFPQTSVDSTGLPFVEVSLAQEASKKGLIEEAAAPGGRATEFPEDFVTLISIRQIDG